MLDSGKSYYYHNWNAYTIESNWVQNDGATERPILQFSSTGAGNSALITDFLLQVHLTAAKTFSFLIKYGATLGGTLVAIADANVPQRNFNKDAFVTNYTGAMKKADPQVGTPPTIADGTTIYTYSMIGLGQTNSFLDKQLWLPINCIQNTIITVSVVAADATDMYCKAAINFYMR